MKKTILLSLYFSLSFFALSAQVGIGTTTPNPDAMLELSSTDRGFLLPRIALTAINDPAPMEAHLAGMTVYNTATSGAGEYKVFPGIYVNNGVEWMRTGNDARSEARWVNESGKVVLLHLSDAGTFRPAGTEFEVYDNGKIGIGTENPSSKITVDMQSMKGGVVVTGLPSFTKSMNFSELAETGQGEINWRKAGTTAFSAAIRSVGEETFGRKGIAFFTVEENSTSSNAVEQMRIAANGNIGMRNALMTSYTPTARFGIQTNQRLIGMNVEGIKIYQTSGNLGVIEHADDFSIQITGEDEDFLLSSDKGTLVVNGHASALGGIQMKTGNVTRMEILGKDSDDGYDGVAIYNINSAITAKFTADGKVGIGTSNPAEKMDVQGAVKLKDGGYTSITDGATGPTPAGGAGTMVFLGNSFYGWNGTVWKKLDN